METRLIGGNLAVDFVNTRTGPEDLLTGYPELLAWGVHAGALTDTEAAALRRSARKDPAGAEAAFARSLETRDYLDRILRALATQRQPDKGALARLRDDEADALGHAGLSRAGGFAWSWREDRSLARPLRPVVHAAVQLLTAGPLDRIKGCEGCSFLFVDESKNRSRRWCSMEDCGTAEKVRRYVAARRSARSR